MCYLSSQKWWPLGQGTGFSTVCTACRAAELWPQQVLGDRMTTYAKGGSLAGGYWVTAQVFNVLTLFHSILLPQTLLPPLPLVFSHWNWGVVGNLYKSAESRGSSAGLRKGTGSQASQLLQPYLPAGLSDLRPVNIAWQRQRHRLSKCHLDNAALISGSESQALCSLLCLLPMRVSVS